MAKAMKAVKVSKPMKAMKVAKAMKAKKAMKVSKVAMGKRAKSSVFSGRKEKTSSGLKKTDLVKNKTGKIVSKKMSLVAKKRYASTIGKWTVAVTKARKALGVKGFVAVKRGSALYNKAKSFYKR
eukprot:NODE_26688_length_541_cov_70.768116.p1 GENE.NODE_26688_length_541_cov_70.768116~~NODE_26688_length_541_cov_70.768116.p1  ORF type:complete len:125 (-),score=39.80 NODE_26688_length_541_cov_70.768116:66-440(-)